tara:strand:- start:622 stop:987 length:366 start_codon:yes stop_codon:yes gene_type:complete
MKSTYIVKQVAIPKELRDLPNQKGWDGAIAESDHWRVKMEYQHFGCKKGFNMDDLEFFTDTYEVEAESLDDVFRITNLWDDESAVKRFRVGHSTSVGDIITDTSTDKMYMVDGFGFSEVAA